MFFIVCTLEHDVVKTKTECIALDFWLFYCTRDVQIFGNYWNPKSVEVQIYGVHQSSFNYLYLHTYTRIYCGLGLRKGILYSHVIWQHWIGICNLVLVQIKVNSSKALHKYAWLDHRWSCITVNSRQVVNRADTYHSYLIF